MIQTAIADAGFARQTAKGSAAANPTYQNGVKGGQIAQVEIEQDVEDLTSGKRVAGHANRTAAIPGADWTTRAWPDQIGLLLYLALGGYAVTGTGPYEHVFTVGGSLPYATVWGTQDGNHFRLDDAKIDELGLSWDRNNPLEVGVTWIGTDLTPGVSDPTPATDVNCDTYLTPVGGTFQVDADGATPATAKVISGEFTIANGLVSDPISGAITPDDVDEARIDLGVSLTIKPDNANLFRETVFGSAAGTDISETVVYGSLAITFTDGTNTLLFEASRVPFLTSLPDVDPSGGPAEITLEGMLLGCSNEAIEVTLTNSVADYTA